jgi:hypothetical protein
VYLKKQENLKFRLLIRFDLISTVNLIICFQKISNEINKFKKNAMINLKKKNDC